MEGSRRIGEFSCDSARSWNGSDSLTRERDIRASLKRVVATVGCTVPGRRVFPHSFPARMPLEVAALAVQEFTSPGHTVLDPMMGSGVVVRAASAHNRVAIGVDIDPLAVTIASAMTSSISVGKLKQDADEVLINARRLLKRRTFVAKALQEFPEEDLRFLDYWFPEESAHQLIALSASMDEVCSTKTWPCLASIFSSLIISRGSGVTRAMDLSRSRPHRVDGKIVKEPFNLWSIHTSRFEKFFTEREAMSRTRLMWGDARALRMPAASVDAIITSPPYLDAIDYFRTSKFSLVFLGKRLAELRSLRSISVGTRVGLAQGLLPIDLEQLVDVKVTDAKRRPIVRRYLSDMLAAMRNSVEVLKPGGRALYVVGPSLLSRREYDAAGVFEMLAAEAGLRLIAKGRRSLPEARRSLPPPKRSARAQSINKRMNCEYFLAFMKD